MFTNASDEFYNDEIIDELKKKFNHETTDRKMKIKILSVLPKKWSAPKIQNIFGANHGAEALMHFKWEKFCQIISIRHLLIPIGIWLLLYHHFQLVTFVTIGHHWKVPLVTFVTITDGKQ